MGKLLGMADPEEPFAAALLQDMAIPVLAAAATELYKGLLQVRAQQGVRLSDLEEEVCGWSHASVGGLLARRWHLPGQFAELIENHAAAAAWTAKYEAEPAEPGSKGNLVVALSAMLPAGNDPVWSECAAFEDCYQRVAPPGSPLLTAMLAQVDKDFSQFAPVLKVAVPAKSLLDRYHDVAAAPA